MTTSLCRCLLLPALALLLVSLGSPAEAQTPQGQALHGDVPSSGLGLVVWEGGTVDALANATAVDGCTLRSGWIIQNGAFLGYLVNAPEAVNHAFLEAFPGGALPSGPVILVCGAGSPGRGTPSGSTRAIEGTRCRLFPDDNPWAMRVDDLPVHPDSERYLDYIAGLGGNQFLHADFGSNPDYGIPFTVVPEDQPDVSVTFEYEDESDPGPYPIPPDVRIEAGSDRHALLVRDGQCRLYELFALERGGGTWHAGSGAIFDLNSNALRPDGWTSADAAGLPIFAGLARYDEVQSGRIEHALRFTVSRTQRAYVHPATHFASSVTDSAAPPMGLRLRLRADFDISNYHGDARVILEALREYGMIVADNGSNWYVSGATDSRWDDDDLNQLKTVPGSAFEVVDTGPIAAR